MTCFLSLKWVCTYNNDITNFLTLRWVHGGVIFNPHALCVSANLEMVEKHNPRKYMFAFSTHWAAKHRASGAWTMQCLEAFLERIWPHLNHYMSSSSTFLFRQPTTSCTTKWFLHAFFETWVQQVTDSCTRLAQKREQWYVLKSLRNKPFFLWLNAPQKTKHAFFKK